MISTADFRNGMVVVLDDNLMEIVEFQHVKPGKGGAFVRTKFKNILTGRVVEKTFRAGEKMEEARIEDETYQYLYREDTFFHFMHTDTFEQITVGENVVGTLKDFVRENESITLVFYNGKVISVKIPNFVNLKVVRCDPGVQGDRAQSGTKPATLETGRVIQVPLFLSEGTTVRVDTRTGAYIERVN